MSLGESEIAALADAQSLKDGEKLAYGAWQEVGADGDAVWGKIKGSGKKPYEVCIDLNDWRLASRCTCPSRKFPCKHAVGLALRYARDAGAFPVAEAPEDVKTWMAGRKAAKKKAELPAAPPPDADAPAVKSKSAAARDRKVAAGLDELRLRLRDVMQQGISGQRQRGYKLWDEMAKRMVDAQASGLAARLRAIGGWLSGGSAPAHILDEIARLYLVTECYPRIESLPLDVQADVRMMIGFTVPKNDVLAGAAHADQWVVRGVVTESDGSMKSRRVWLHAPAAGKWALLLDFTQQHTHFEVNYPVGQRFSAQIVYYPSAYPQRALVKERSNLDFDTEKLPAGGYPHISAALDAYASALARSPFVERFPMLLSDIGVGEEGNALYMYDKDGARLPMPASMRGTPRFVFSAAGGHGLSVFGEWNGFVLQPLSVYADSSVYVF